MTTSAPSSRAAAPLRTLVSYLLFPALFGGSVWAAWLGFRAGADPVLWSLAVTIASLVAVAALEAVIPRKPDVSLFRDPQALNDLLHGGLLSLVGVPTGRAAASLAAAGLVGGTGQAAALALWPSSWHPAAQLLLVVGVADFFDYWKHRAYHRFDRLWWFHSIHHSATSMHALKAARLHFAEGFIRYLVATAPLGLLGAPAELLLWYALLDNFRGNLNHTNLDLRFPRFAHYLFATLDFHSVHHARERRLQDSNFASTPLFDLLFGTFRDPTQHAVAAIGILDDPVPSGFAAQLALPFRKLWP